jgi:hypothetical protein
MAGSCELGNEHSGSMILIIFFVGDRMFAAQERLNFME